MRWNLTRVLIAILMVFFAGVVLATRVLLPRAIGGAPGRLAEMPPIVDRSNIYSEAGANRLAPAVANDPPRVYVPDIESDDVTVIDPASLRVVDRFSAGRNPQHVVPSWDLRTLWVTGSAGHRGGGSLMPIDPAIGKPGVVLPVPDAYNMYFTPDGRAAMVVAEDERRLEFRDPHDMRLIDSLTIGECPGLNHGDFAADGSYAIFTCEFGGALVKLDMIRNRVVGVLRLGRTSMPQDVRVAPTGSLFYVADMLKDGVHLVDGVSFAIIGFIPTGIGAHGLCFSRDAHRLYVSDRGSHSVRGAPHGPGNIAVIDLATNRVVHVWRIPSGGSPDMGNLDARGRYLWVSGRFDDVAYRFDTRNGAVISIPVGREPHGLTIWPQPGRYSLGHTGIMR